MTQHEDPAATPNPGSGGMLQAFKTLGFVTGLGLEFAALVVAGALAGQWLDKRWGSSPWATVGGIALGVAACGLQLWRVLVVLRRAQRARDASSQEQA